jgi:hypothetical protein
MRGFDMMKKLLLVLFSIASSQVNVNASLPEPEIPAQAASRLLTAEAKAEFEQFGTQLRQVTFQPAQLTPDVLNNLLGQFIALMDYRNKARDVIYAANLEVHPSQITGNALAEIERQRLAAVANLLSQPVRTQLTQVDELTRRFPQTHGTFVTEFYNARCDYLTFDEVLKTTDQRIDWAKCEQPPLLNRTSDYGELSNLEIDFLINTNGHVYQDPFICFADALRRFVRHMTRQIELGREQKLNIQSLK